MSKIEEVYQEIKDIDKVDHCILSEAVCKLGEEHGELIRALNKTFGRKVHSDTKEEITDEILGEVADTLQNLLLIASRFNFTIDEILDKLRNKNLKWIANIEQRNEEN